MLIIAERINSSRKQIAQAIAAGDRDFIQGEAKAQTLAGANYIDVNAGTFVGEETEKLGWIAEAVQEVTELPLCIDSPDPVVIKAILPLLTKTPMINSHHPGTFPDRGDPATGRRISDEGDCPVPGRKGVVRDGRPEGGAG